MTTTESETGDRHHRPAAPGCRKCRQPQPRDWDLADGETVARVLIMGFFQMPNLGRVRIREPSILAVS